MTMNAIEILDREFPAAPTFRSLVYNRFVEMNWWSIKHSFSVGWRYIPGDICYVFLILGRLEVYAGRL